MRGFLLPFLAFTVSALTRSTIMVGTPDSIIEEEMRRNTCIWVFGQYVEMDRAKKLTDAEKDNPRGQTTTVRHILRDLDLKGLIPICESSILPKYQDLSGSITAVQFLDNVLPDLAKDPAKVVVWLNKMAALQEQLQTTGGANTTVMGHVTDTSNYTVKHASKE